MFSLPRRCVWWKDAGCSTLQGRRHNIRLANMDDGRLEHASYLADSGQRRSSSSLGGEDTLAFAGLSHKKTVSINLHSSFFCLLDELTREKNKSHPFPRSCDDVLRLSPPITFLDRWAVNHHYFYCLIILIHHDPEIWSEDASACNPERFAEGMSKECFWLK